MKLRLMGLSFVQKMFGSNILTWRWWKRFIFMATYEQQTEDCEHTDVWSHVCVHLLNLKSNIHLFFSSTISLHYGFILRRTSVCSVNSEAKPCWNISVIIKDINLLMVAQKMGHHQESARSIRGPSCMILFDKPSTTLLHQKLGRRDAQSSWG